LEAGLNSGSNDGSDKNEKPLDSVYERVDSLLYPIMLRLDGRSCVVVGGGEVAARKVKGLLAANACVTVISPELYADLQSLADDGIISVEIKPYVSGDLADKRPLLVFAATDDPSVNRAVADEARSLGALVNTTDDGTSGDFHNLPSARRGNITVAVSTGGNHPALAKALAARLADAITDEDVKAAETRSKP
jgi:precorrin-2 dehydrogenase/sirohydrochlorin ferrochelatase